MYSTGYPAIVRGLKSRIDQLERELSLTRPVIEAAREQRASWFNLSPQVADSVGLQLGTGPASGWASATGGTEEAVRAYDDAKEQP